MEVKLTELVDRLKAAIHDNLKTVVLYGSAVTGEFRAGHSGLNIVCVVGRVNAELRDMTLHNRILLGTDFLAEFEVPLQLHRLQVERELRTAWLRLRQAILAAPLSNKVHLGIMMNSVSPFCALFRHALLALGQEMPTTKRESVDAIASLTGGHPTVFQGILDLREGKRKKREIDVEASLNAYLELVEVVTNEVDRRLGSGCRFL